MNCPGSATNLKASNSTLLSCTAPDTRSRIPNKRISGNNTEGGINALFVAGSLQTGPC